MRASYKIHEDGRQLFSGAKGAHKYVLVSELDPEHPNKDCKDHASGRQGQSGAVDCRMNGESRYDFETGLWSNDKGEKYKNGARVE